MNQQPSEPERNKLALSHWYNIYQIGIRVVCPWCNIETELSLFNMNPHCSALQHAQSCDWPKILQIKLPTRAEIRKDTRNKT